MSYLGQLSQQQQQAVVWLAILLGVVVVGGLVIMVLRRMLKEPTSNGLENGGFSLSELREMRDRGEITSEEYEATRARVIAKVKSSGGLSPDPHRPPPNTPDSSADR